MQSNALSVIHKLVRHKLFAVAHRLATAGDGDDASLRAAIHEAIDMLHGHSEQEDAWLLPGLEAAAPELARQLEDQHERLERQLKAICAMGDRLLRLPASRRPAVRKQLHDDWNRFVADCLLHMDEEERAMQPLLGDRATLSSVAETTLAMERTAADEFLTNLWRVITPQERLAIERARLRLQLARVTAGIEDKAA